MSETADIAATPAPAPLPGSTSWEQLAAIHPAIIVEPGAANPPGHGARDPGDSIGVGNVEESA